MSLYISVHCRFCKKDQVLDRAQQHESEKSILQKTLPRSFMLLTPICLFGWLPRPKKTCSPKASLAETRIPKKRKIEFSTDMEGNARSDLSKVEVERPKARADLEY